MFGNLVEELNYWTACCNEESEADGAEFEYCEQRFNMTLDAIKEVREIVLGDLDEYFEECKEFDIPVDLSYFRIRRQLQESTFEALRG